MSRFDPKNAYDRPYIQLIPLIDILFFALVFFMILSVYYHAESQIEINVPKSSQSVDPQRSPTAVVINVNTNGEYIINGQAYDAKGLEDMMRKLTLLSPNQAVIIRADEKTYHHYVIQTLDICARTNIRDISFATSEGK
ncbi:MAG: biopolymer transporter ExbD [Candidatus Omnitrophica bacterium]|nr:biopolymer transporter ExbD [Candidatus Omnitrophota bacterium]